MIKRLTKLPVNGICLLLATLGLGVLLARWVVVFWTPPVTPQVNSSEFVAAAATRELFGQAQPVVEPEPQALAQQEQAPAELLPGASLLGVFAATKGNYGFAVLQLEGGAQLSVVVGQPVSGDVVLQSVMKDAVILAQGGVTQRLDLQGLQALNTAGQAMEAGAPVQADVPTNMDMEQQQ